jgi:hypothetical protein
VFLYDVSFEVLGSGKTPGKRWTGLRVARSGGRPISLVRSAIRNVLRIIDVLPAFYAVGMTAIFVTERNQRVGDLVAGTLVVRERVGERRAAARTAPEAVDPGPAAAWDLGAISAGDTAAITAFLERRSDLAGDRRAAIARELAHRLRPRVAGAPADIPDERFLELIAAAKAARAEWAAFSRSSFGSCRYGAWISSSAPGMPVCSSRPRSVSAFSSAPSSTATFVSQSQTRNTTTPPSVPYVSL